MRMTLQKIVYLRVTTVLCHKIFIQQKPKHIVLKKKKNLVSYCKKQY